MRKLLHTGLIVVIVSLGGHSLIQGAQKKKESKQATLNTFLLETAKRGNMDGVLKAIKDGANINAHDKDGHTPIMIAAERESIPMLKVFVDLGANVNAQNQKGNTALLTVARSSGNQEIMEYLIQNGANIKLTNKNGQSAESYPKVKSIADKMPKKSIEKEKSIAEEKLAEEEAIPSKQDKLTPEQEEHKRQLSDKLVIAATGGNNVGVKDLLHAGADANAQDASGQTALMLAAIGGYDDVVQTLINAGANPNKKNALGNTALMLTRNADVTRVLLESEGIDVSLRNNEGKTALDLAHEKAKVKPPKRIKEIIELLELKSAMNLKAEKNQQQKEQLLKQQQAAELNAFKQRQAAKKEKRKLARKAKKAQLRASEEKEGCPEADQPPAYESDEEKDSDSEDIELLAPPKYE